MKPRITHLLVAATFASVLAPPGDAAGDGDRPSEATSLLGEPLPRVTVDAGFAARQEAAIEALRARLGAGTAAAAVAADDADVRVWLGRRLGYLGRYGEAIAVFSAGMARHPHDARFLRHRGHRLLSTRRFGEAAADFERGLDLVAGRPDTVEPDGLPNLLNRPTGTLKSNLWYHLGLVRYLEGDFARAAEAYGACAALADNPDLLAAATYWQVLALERIGRPDEAARALGRMPRHAVLIENLDYQRLLALFHGDADPADLLARHEPGTLGSATLGYGIGAWHLIEGRPDEARMQWQKVLESPGWSAFGYIAAEAEVARSADGADR